MAKALKEWREPLNPSEDDWILPNRGMKGRINGKERMRGDTFTDHWHRLRNRYKLPKLTPKDMRHWVDTMLVNAQQGDPPLLENSRAKMMGHDFADLNRTMGAVYYSDEWEPVIENQRQVLPEGVLDRFNVRNVLIEDDVPLELKAAWRDYVATKRGLMDLMSTMEALRMKQISRIAAKDASHV